MIFGIFLRVVCPIKIDREVFEWSRNKMHGKIDGHNCYFNIDWVIFNEATRICFQLIFDSFQSIDTPSYWFWILVSIDLLTQKVLFLRLFWCIFGVNKDYVLFGLFFHKWINLFFSLIDWLSEPSAQIKFS